MPVPTAISAPTVVSDWLGAGGQGGRLSHRQVRRDTPEEYVRHNSEKALIRQCKFAPMDCEPEFAEPDIENGALPPRVNL